MFHSESASNKDYSTPIPKSSTELIARANSLRKRSKGQRRKELPREFKSGNSVRSPLEMQQRRFATKEGEVPDQKLERTLVDDVNYQPEEKVAPFAETIPSRTNQKDKLRSIAYEIPEVHFSGEICKGSQFDGNYLSCKWSIEWSQNTWTLLEGANKGQSQYAFNSDDFSCVWNHPIDLHFTTGNMKGWPRILLQVWNLDTYGRTNLVGYGFTHFPESPGAK